VIRATGLAVATILGGLSCPLAAQQRDDPARLDDFAVTASADNSLQVQQVSNGTDKVASTPQPRGRAIVPAQPVGQANAAVPQLSTAGQPPEPVQLSKAGARPDESASAVSSTAESRPQGVQRLGGTDRCDPQLGDAALARCRQILELRAQEFHAPAPPQLSAEEQLLAEQRANQDQDATRSPEARLRLASRDDPDAGLESNQELATLYLDKQSPPPNPTPDQATPQLDPSLAQVLQGLQISPTTAQGGQ
jgi:hypothetical protein